MCWDIIRYDICTIWYGTARYDTIRNDTIRYFRKRYDTMRYGTIRYDPIGYNAIRYFRKQYNTIGYYTVRYDTIRYDTIRYDIIRYGTIRYYTIRSLTRYQPLRSLRSSNKGLLLVPKFKLKSYGARAFSVCGPALWNGLPENLRLNTNSFDSFKKNLKTHLYREAYVN